MKNKVIVLDLGIFTHRTYFASLSGSGMNEKYTCFSMMLSNLKIIGVNEGDLVICACEGLNNWRKQQSTEYKSDRKKIPQGFWDKMNDMMDDIEIATNWAVIKVPTLEADDVMAVACTYFKDKEVVLVTYDHDLEQMWIYDNVKIFSPHPKSKKYKVKPDDYNVYKQIAKSVEKEAGDGLKSDITTKEERENREMLVNLISLPEFVEEPIKKEFGMIDYKKDIRLDLLPGKKIPETFMDIYKSDKVVTYEQQVAKEEKKLLRIKAKKEAEKIAKKKAKEKAKKEAK